MNRVFIFPVVLMVLTSCTVAPVEEGDKSVVTFRLSYGFYNYNSIKLDYDYRRKGLFLIFPAIPGAVFGDPTNDIVRVVKVSGNNRFDLTLPADMDGRAAEMSDPDLNISPADTRILRLGTFHAYSDTPDNIGGGGLINVKTGNYVNLVYFSKPAKIEGTLLANGDIFSFKINVIKQGWAWLELVKVSDKAYRVMTYKGNLEDIEFMVLLDEQMI